MHLINFEGCVVDTLNKDGTAWDGDSEAWFIPKQIAEAIGASNPSVYARKILLRNPEKFEGFRSRTNLVLEGIGEREINIINENGLYMFLMASNLPQATSFQRQVSETIKQIRKNKTSIAKAIPQNYKEAVAALLGQLEENEKLQEEIVEQKPKVELFHKMISAENNQTFNEVAKSLNWGRNKLLELLRDKEILMWNNLPYQRYLDSKYFFVHEVYKNKRNFPQTLVTAKGLEFVGKIVKKHEDEKSLLVSVD
ncbi:phage antirepressor KilAC domain-containing protein [Paenibacillus polymyxa]|uniref:phage antirepressor KilAC domain-containing protein n=1 Tax=Paenibacillus polymyxa TaxID=1406 RepID=UPI002AB4FA04|nr:phage antirepressor KilAC domain-containing protein [Paenibacillus polymyxa]MDY8021282.1 phage antirepressor KilAC domain-containing protein [Paenibacillus polymyxa]